MDDKPISVVYTKYDGALHWNHHETILLGEDQHGVWIGGRAGTTGRRGHEPPITYRHPFVFLMPRRNWWTATFNAAPHRTEIYCDITTVPRWTSDAMVTMVDLDLDVIRRRNGTVFLDDQDEFAEHQVRYGYPPQVIASAEQSAARLMTAVAAGEEPFGEAARTWLTLVGA